MTSTPFDSTRRMILPSILSADFARLGAEIDQVLASGADFLHLDIMDGHFVPNISFGPPIIRCVRKHTRAYLDAHLMITDPMRYAPAMAAAGANLLTYHVEVIEDHEAMARQIRDLGCQVGVAINPPTPVERIFPALQHADLVLVMSVNPGFSGQKFIAEALPKAAEIRKRLGKHQRLEMDGGINSATIEPVRDAGVDWFVVASAIFDQPDRPKVIGELRSILTT